MELSTNKTGKAKTLDNKFNRVLYVSFTILSLYYFIFSTDKMQGVACLGIALAFDPFNQKQPFLERPLYQKVWLVIHLVLVFIPLTINLLHIKLF